MPHRGRKRTALDVKLRAAPEARRCSSHRIKNRKAAKRIALEVAVAASVCGICGSQSLYRDSQLCKPCFSDDVADECLALNAITVNATRYDQGIE